MLSAILARTDFGFRAPSLDKAHRTCRNILNRIEASNANMERLALQVASMDIGSTKRSGPVASTAPLDDDAPIAPDISPEAAKIANATIEAENMAQVLRKAIRVRRKEPKLTTVSSSAPKDTSAFNVPAFPKVVLGPVGDISDIPVPTWPAEDDAEDAGASRHRSRRQTRHTSAVQYTPKSTTNATQPAMAFDWGGLQNFKPS